MYDDNDDELENDEEFEDDEDYEMSELESWYDDNFGYFIREPKIITGITEEITLFYDTVYIPIITELAPLIRKLMLKQYPIIRGESRPMVADYIDSVIHSAGHDLVMQIYMIVQDQKEGVNFREKNPDFESWVSFYGRPAETPVPDYTFFDEYPEIAKTLTDQQKKEIAEESCEDEKICFVEEERLKKEYYDIVQPVVLKYYQDLDELGYEAWIMYAVQMREIYEEYKYRCEHLDTFIEYGFDEQDIDLDHKDFMEKFSLKFDEREKLKQAKADEELQFPQNLN